MGTVEKANFTAVAASLAAQTKGAIAPTPVKVQTRLQEYYITDTITRSSSTMAKCVSFHFLISNRGILSGFDLEFNVFSLTTFFIWDGIELGHCSLLHGFEVEDSIDEHEVVDDEHLPEE